MVVNQFMHLRDFQGVELGHVAVSVADVATYQGCSKTTARRVLEDMVAEGFLWREFIPGGAFGYVVYGPIVAGSEA